jgi:hypothetical protein
MVLVKEECRWEAGFLTDRVDGGGGGRLRRRLGEAGRTISSGLLEECAWGRWMAI